MAKQIAKCCQCPKTATGRREIKTLFGFRNTTHVWVDGRTTEKEYTQSRCRVCRSAHAKLMRERRAKEAKRKTKTVKTFSKSIHDKVAVGTAKRGGRKVNAPTVKRLYKKAYPKDTKVRDTAYMRKKLGL